jgi:hypothetical protein
MGYSDSRRSDRSVVDGQERRSVTSNMTEPARFPTRVDFWLVAVLVIALTASIWSIVMSFRDDPVSGWIGLVSMGGLIILLSLLTIPTEYTIGESELTIRSGVIRTRIPLASIVRVYPTANPLSAPAWSLDRLGIQYSKKRGRALALISPAAQHEFLTLLAERAGLERVGSELRRPETAGGT